MQCTFITISHQPRRLGNSPCAGLIFSAVVLIHSKESSQLLITFENEPLTVSPAIDRTRQAPVSMNIFVTFARFAEIRQHLLRRYDNTYLLRMYDDVCCCCCCSCCGYMVTLARKYRIAHGIVSPLLLLLLSRKSLLSWYNPREALD